MLKNVVVALCLLAASALPALAQAKGEAERPVRSTLVLKQPLQDPELKGYTMHTIVVELGPAAVDTVDHRHGAEVFGYILEGSIVTRVNDGPETTYSAGEMFYEPRGALHGHFQNPDRERKARALVVFLAKDGRELYTRERR